MDSQENFEQFAQNNEFPPTNPNLQFPKPRTPHTEFVGNPTITTTPTTTFLPNMEQFPQEGAEGVSVIHNLIHQLNLSARRAVEQGQQSEETTQPPIQPSTKTKKRTIAESKAEATRKAREKRAANAEIARLKKEENQRNRQKRLEDRRKIEESSQQEEQTEDEKQEEIDDQREVIIESIEED